MTLPYLLIQHTATTTPGHVLPWLKSRGLNYRHVQMHKGDELPTAAEIRGLILCGGGVHIHQDQQYPWLKAEKKLLAQIIAAEKPVVGLCLGGQLCAEALGAWVGPHPKGWEIGWHPVEIKAQAGLSGFEKKKALHVSQYHRYVFDAPPEAEIVASNDWWKTQAFLWKNHVLAFQFHPERDLAANRDLARDPEWPTEGLIQSRSKVLELGECYEPETENWFYEVMDGFLLKNSEREANEKAPKHSTRQSVV